MPIGLTNSTTITMDNLTYIANSSTPAHFIANVNEIVFNGIAFFLILSTLWFILFVIMQKVEKRDTGITNPLHNAMYSGTIITLMSFFARATEVYVYGTKKGLLTDKLLWIFPLITIAIALILWMTKD